MRDERWLLPSRFCRDALCTGKVDLKFRAFADFALEPDIAAALLDDPVNRRQTQARSFALLLRSVKRLEYVGLHFGAHSRAGVAYLQHHVWPRHDIPFAAGRVVVPNSRSSLHFLF